MELIKLWVKKREVTYFKEKPLPLITFECSLQLLKVKVVPVFVVKAHMEGICIASLILNIATSEGEQLVATYGGNSINDNRNFQRMNSKTLTLPLTKTTNMHTRVSTTFVIKRSLPFRLQQSCGHGQPLVSQPNFSNGART